MQLMHHEGSDAGRQCEGGRGMTTGDGATGSAMDDHRSSAIFLLSGGKYMKKI